MLDRIRESFGPRLSEDEKKLCLSAERNGEIGLNERGVPWMLYHYAQEVDDPDLNPIQRKIQKEARFDPPSTLRRSVNLKEGTLETEDGNFPINPAIVRYLQDQVNARNSQNKIGP